MRPETFKSKIETCKNSLKTKSQDFATANNPTKLSNQNSCSYLFMVRQFFMVAFMLDMHSTSNSTAMKFFPTSTSCIYKVKEQ